MTREKLELLHEELTGLQSAADHLEYSMERCRNLIGQKEMPPEELERLESLTIRNLRNQMIHEYVEYPVVLSSALQTGHDFVLALIAAANKMIAEIGRRGWA